MTLRDVSIDEKRAGSCPVFPFFIQTARGASFRSPDGRFPRELPKPCGHQNRWKSRRRAAGFVLRMKCLKRPKANRHVPPGHQHLWKLPVESPRHLVF